MRARPTLAERLDQAVDDLIAGKRHTVAAARAAVPAADRGLVETGAALRMTLGASLVSPSFEARLGAPIPKRMRGQSFDLRWDIEANDPGKFILSANLDVGANVALVGATTNNNFGSSTLDDSFPGKFEIQGNTWTITINADKVPNWPEEFTWKLSTSLDGSPGDPKSGRAEDHAPDIGFAQVVES